jgi:hypothetical protein
MKANAGPSTDALRESPWLRTDEACEYLRYRGKHQLRSLYRFIERNGIPTSRRSPRAILLLKSDLDAAIGARRRK